jgi:NAD-dependent deacetylase
MHGELCKALCRLCGDRHVWAVDLGPSHSCNTCHSKGSLRPDIVWFGEMPYEMERILESLAAAEIFVAIGTSGRVYPAAGFAEQAIRAHRIEVNLTDSEISDCFHERRCGMAGAVVPQLVQEWLRP